MSVEKPFAFVKGTMTIKHASEAVKHARYEWNGYEVTAVKQRYFRYLPSEYIRLVNGASGNSRESTAHLIAKEQIVLGRQLCCRTQDGICLLYMRDLIMEKRIGTRTPDITAFVDFCTPYWQLANQKIFIEIHFANAVQEEARINDLRALGGPVLEFHLPREYLNQINIADNNPGRFRDTIRTILTTGWNEGTWITPPPLLRKTTLQNIFL